jgi:hypothetical protein
VSVCGVESQCRVSVSRSRGVGICDKARRLKLGTSGVLAVGYRVSRCWRICQETLPNDENDWRYWREKRVIVFATMGNAEGRVAVWNS